MYCSTYYLEKIIKILSHEGSLAYQLICLLFPPSAFKTAHLVLWKDQNQYYQNLINREKMPRCFRGCHRDCRSGKLLRNSTSTTDVSNVIRHKWKHDILYTLVQSWRVYIKFHKNALGTCTWNRYFFGCNLYLIGRKVIVVCSYLNQK